MEIDLIKGRKDKFMKENQLNILKRREDYSMKLRKDKLQESMMERRYASLQNNIEDDKKYSIILTDLGLANEFTETFFKTENKLEFALRLLKEQDTSLRKFGIRQVRNYSDTLKKNSKLDPLLKNAVYKEILDILFNPEDLQEVFEASWIVLNFSQCSTEFTNYVAQPEILKRLFDTMVNQRDLQITNHFLYIFANIMGESQEAHCQVTSVVDIIPYVCTMMQDEKLPVFFRSTCIWTIANICEYLNERIVSFVLPLIPDIAKYTKSNIHKDIFSESFQCVAKLAKSAAMYNNDELTNAILDLNLYKQLLSNINMSTDLFDLRAIFTIIGNLSYASDEFIHQFFEKEGIQKIQSLLEEILMTIKNDPTFLKRAGGVIKNVCWALTNICGVGNGRIKGYLIRRVDIPKILLSLYTFVSARDIKIEIISFFNNALDTDVMNIKTELTRLPILEIFCQELLNEDKSISFTCLEGIYRFLTYGETLMKGRNIILEELQHNETINKIESLENSGEEDISSLSTKILTNFLTESVGGQA